MRVVALASGSSGNATLIQAGDDSILIDAGLPTKAIEAALRDLDVNPRRLAAIFLTHEHSDHIASAGVLARRYAVPLVGNEHTLATANLGKASKELLPCGGSIRIGSLRISSFALPHDSAEPVGYRIEEGPVRVCLATDLGHAPLWLEDELHAANLIILEANHDRARLLAGPYPSTLKTRIIGERGHLSNQQAADSIVASASGRPQWVWLAHLSDINNSPRQALQTVKSALRTAGIGSVQVSVALRDRRSLTWESEHCFAQASLGL